MIYLDYNATTPVDPVVLERMLPYFSEQFGNASSAAHAYGWAASEAVKQAREILAGHIGAEERELIFTSGATESINLALKGVAEAYRSKGTHIITCQTEHKAVLDTCKALEFDRFTVTYLPVDAHGQVDVQAFSDAITDQTILAAFMWANNETGVVHPVADLYAVARERGVLLLTDATQALGKLPVSAEHADLLAVSGHKVYGPKGIGALYVSRRNPRVRLVPHLDGGGQERGLRGGTLNVPGIVGLGAAVDLAAGQIGTEAARLATLRDRLEAGLQERLDDVTVNGASAHRLPNTANLQFAGIRADTFMAAARGLAVSAGSACSSATGKPSHVLKAMGLTDAEAFASIRFSLGRDTTPADIEAAIDEITAVVGTIRADTAHVVAS